MLAQVTVCALWAGVFTVVSYLPALPHGRLHLGISEATTSLLAVLWQVQATSVTLVLVLVVFVFGLLPQGRGRLTYREFLRRTGALQLTTFNVASLLFIGMVLLGLGHQVPPAGSSPGYGWAVATASVVALISMATIVAVLARTLQAINPATQTAVQRDFQRAAVVLAGLGELLGQKSAEVMAAGDWPFAFTPAYPGPGLTVSADGSGVVRDVSVWRLSLLAKAASHWHHGEPAVRVWLGKSVSAGTPLMTVDSSSGRLERWLAQRCVRTRTAPPDLLTGALTALYGDTLDHIRAARPTEAVDGMREVSNLPELLWQAYAAHGRTYEPSQGGPVVLYPQEGAGRRIDAMVNDLLRAAAVSADDTVRREASDLPRKIALEAVRRQASGAVPDMLHQLEGVYIAVAGDLSEGGLRDLPLTGLARSRLQAPFSSLLSFTGYHLATAVDQAAAGSATGWDGRTLPSAEFLLTQLRAANEGMLRLLRRAVQFRDIVTVRHVLDKWKMPDLFLARNAIQQAAGSTSATASMQDLAHSLSETEAALNAMTLRLLAAALAAERTDYGETAPPASRLLGDSGAVTDVVLARLPNGRLWDVLEKAIQDAGRDWGWQYSDDEIFAPGVVDVRPIDTVTPLLKAFSLAVISRPELVAEAEPSRQFVLDRGDALIAEIAQAPAGQNGWLLRHSYNPETVVGTATALEARLKQAIQAAQRELEEEIRASRVQPEALAEVRQTAGIAFREQDLTAPLFAWAGRLLPGTGLRATPSSLIALRHNLTDTGRSEQITQHYGRALGRHLAAKTLEQLLLAAARAGDKVTVRREDIGAAVRDAITWLSARTGEHTAGNRTVMFIPDLPYTLRNDLGVTASQSRDGRSGAHDPVARRLGLNDSLGSRIAGTIEDVPVFLTGSLQEQVLVIDLARFADLRRDTPGSAGSPDPELMLHEPVDPLRSLTGSGNAESNLVGGSLLDLLQVRLILSLPTNIEVDEAAAVRVIRIE